MRGSVSVPTGPEGLPRPARPPRPTGARPSQTPLEVEPATASEVGPPESRPTVAVWKATWLAPSQTFVRDQVAAMTRWRPFLVGLRRSPQSILEPDHAPFGTSKAGRIVHGLRAGTGYRGVYDRVLRDAGASLVHAHFGTSAVRVLPVVERLRLPLVVTFHGYDVSLEPFRPGPAGTAYRRDLPRVLDRADALLAVSEHLAEGLLRLGAPEHKVHVQPIGIPVERRVPPTTDRRGVVFVGRLVDVKGPDHLLAALGRLGALGRSVPVRVVGDGPLAGELRRTADELGLDVTFTGRLSSDGVAEELARAALFCGPSRTTEQGQQEAFGIVFLEAALHGLPVVAYRHGGVAEAVVDGGTGLLAPEGDVAALAGHLEDLLADPHRARVLGAAGRERVLRDFDVHHRTARLEELYDDVVERADRRYSV